MARRLAASCVLWLVGCAAEQVRPPWVGSVLGETVYSTACPAADAVPDHERVYFATREEAERSGYSVASTAICSATGGAEAGETAIPRSDGGESIPGSRATAEPMPTQEGDASAPRRTRPCRIERVIDGDTVICGGEERVRLLMIDTPERDQAPYGVQATRALEELIRGQPTVRLELDVQREDQHGRTLAYLWLEDGRMLNEEMARSGFAVALVYPPNVRYDERIRSAVAGAREARRGLWATEAFQCLPVDHRAGRC